ncbi:MAG: two-component system response regulator [Acidimicrobiaceae bacterium]|nr:two-component system response regulator [Acidimicrobiaceae bacterium]
MTSQVLLIEDNEQNRYLTTFLLERNGYSVRVAHDGLSGIRSATESPPDVILLDIQLPTMDGYAVARSLRANAALDRTPIVAVTSYAMVGDREKCLEAGCSGYIEKPIDPETFVGQVEAIADDHRSGFDGGPA